MEWALESGRCRGEGGGGSAGARLVRQDSYETRKAVAASPVDSLQQVASDRSQEKKNRRVGGLLGCSCGKKGDADTSLKRPLTECQWTCDANSPTTANPNQLSGGGPVQLSVHWCIWCIWCTMGPDPIGGNLHEGTSQDGHCCLILSAGDSRWGRGRIANCEVQCGWCRGW